MPLYEYLKNALKRVAVPPAIQEEIVCGTQQVVVRTLTPIQKRGRAGGAVKVAVDGWYGVNWAGLGASLIDVAAGHGVLILVVSAAELYFPRHEIEDYRQPFANAIPGGCRHRGKLWLRSARLSSDHSGTKDRLVAEVILAAA